MNGIQLVPLTDIPTFLRVLVAEDAYSLVNRQ